MKNLNEIMVKTGRKISNNILELLFNTPIVKLNKITPKNSVTIYAKLESYSPGGSVKDRIAFSMIEDAEKKGKLKADSIIVEPTSGNTGIGLALVCAVKGYKCVIVMPESMSIERRKILQLLGAEVVLTPKEKGMQGAVEKADEIVQRNKNAIILQQFENPANPEIHKKTTAQEILKVFPDGFDVFVCGVGTGGTLTGCAEVFKTKFPNIKVVAVEPEYSAVLSGKKPGVHKIQGIGAGFIPKILNTKLIDEIITVKDEDAIETTKLLAKKEAILCGISSGAACFAALQVAKKIKKGKVVTIFPDNIEKYISILD